MNILHLIYLAKMLVTHLLSINKVMLCIRLCDKHTIMPKYILFWFKPFLADSCYIFLHINMLMLALVFSAFEENTKSVNKVILPRYALMHMEKKTLIWHTLIIGCITLQRIFDNQCSRKAKPIYYNKKSSLNSKHFTIYFEMVFLE